MISIEQARAYSDMDIDKLEVVKKCLELAPLGGFCEIGVRRGGTALMAMQTDNCLEFVAVDPYKSFKGFGGEPIEMDPLWFIEAYDLLMDTAKRYKKLFFFFKGTSVEYIESLSEQSPRFSYVLLDGEHTNETVQMELDFFSKHMTKGGVILVDNTDWIQLDFSSWESPRFDMKYRVF